MLAGYLESGLGFSGSNHTFLMDLDYVTRGGKMPFILGIDANEEPSAWSGVGWGGNSFLEHLDAEIVTARNRKITCTGGK